MINPSLVYRAPLAPLEPCCARTGLWHVYGCRFWTPRRDYDGFIVEIVFDNGVSFGHHVLGAHALGRLLMRLAAYREGWRYSLLLAEGNYIDIAHGVAVQTRRL